MSRINHRFIAGLALAGVVLTGAGCFNRAPQQIPREKPRTEIKEDVAEQPIRAFDMIAVTSPGKNDVVTSPLTITGEARGYWYFEASFPVEIYDANGVLLGRYHAEAQSDWMTEDWVGFIAVLEFDEPTTETGVLVLKKDNPSGLPENDRMLEIPVRFEE